MIPMWIHKAIMIIVASARFITAHVQHGHCFLSAPSMGALLRVQVPSQVDHDERSANATA